MPLLKIADFDPNYRESFNGEEIKGDSVYTEANEKIGIVSDILVDEEGHLRYFVVDLGFWIFGKKVLLPVGRTRIDYSANRINAVGLSRQQAEDLPEFNENMAIDYDYEEQVRGVYRSPANTGANTGTTTGASVSPVADATAPVDTSASLDASAPLDATPTAYGTDATRTGYGTDPLYGTDPMDATRTGYGTYDQASTPAAAYGSTATPGITNYDRDTYRYDEHDPSMYAMRDQDHQTLRLYEERLIANKRRVKTGEVTIGKHVETETERVSVPVEKERVVIERVTPADAGRPVAPGEATFREGEVAHMEIYEETPDVRKEAFVREEVRVDKVVDQETVSAEERVRREELDINSGDVPIDDRPDLR